MDNENFKGKSPQYVIERKGADVVKGLSSAVVEERTQIYGKNQLDEEEQETIWDKIKEQFEDRFVRLLLLAAVISFTVSIIGGQHEEDLPAWVEPSVIISIIIANGFIGIYQDYNAEKATQALKKLQSSHCLVLRDGAWTKIESQDLVPGDYIRIQGGDMVPADAFLVKMNSLCLAVDQAPLTGETKEILKTSDVSEEDEELQQNNMVFSGTLAVTGSAEAVVTQIGMKTQTGKIQVAIQAATKDTDDEKTPLGKKLDGFGQFLEKAIFYICITIWAINFGNFWDPLLGGPIKGCLYYFKISVALAVAAIPEGLPAVITTCLALGTRRMTKNNAIIKKLPSVETLGCTTVICSDKTGTLTLNKMVAGQFWLFGGNKSELVSSKVDTDGYRPWGKIESSQISSNNFSGSASVQNFVNCCTINTTCTLAQTGDAFTVQNGTATEGAIFSLANKFGQFAGNNNKDLSFSESIRNQWSVKNVNSFDSKRKAMSVLARKSGSDKNVLFLKGAPEKLIESAQNIQLQNGAKEALTAQDRKELNAKIDAFCNLGLRVVGIAIKEDTGDFATFNGISDKTHPKFEFLKKVENYAQVEQGSTLLGFVGISDPVRKEVPRSIDLCRQAGINVFMITGDNKNTAVAVAKQCGLINDANAQTNTIDGSELQQILEKDPESLRKRLKKVLDNSEGMVFARTTPTQKRDLVKILKEINQVVAMTGDGTNDAAALK